MPGRGYILYDPIPLHRYAYIEPEEEEALGEDIIFIPDLEPETESEPDPEPEPARMPQQNEEAFITFYTQSNEEKLYMATMRNQALGEISTYLKTFIRSFLYA